MWPGWPAEVDAEAEAEAEVVDMMPGGTRSCGE